MHTQISIMYLKHIMHIYILYIYMLSCVYIYIYTNYILCNMYRYIYIMYVCVYVRVCMFKAACTFINRSINQSIDRLSIYIYIYICIDAHVYVRIVCA